MSLEIVIKTCDGETLHGKNENRYCKSDKKALINKCISSVLYSVNRRPEKTKITVVDDCSSEECIDNIKKLLLKTPHETELILRKTRNYNDATLEYFYVARSSTKTMVYCVEDDYLHTPFALSQMEQFYRYAFDQLQRQKDIAIHPFDDPNNYRSRYSEQAHIVMFNNKHWRTNFFTTCTFFTTPGVLNRGWGHLEKFATSYKMDPSISENNTINLIWRNPNVHLFTPMPSLALHMQFEDSIDPLINWQHLWSSIPDFFVEKSSGPSNSPTPTPVIR